MIVYDSEKKYLLSCTDLTARIAAIDAIIDALLINAATSAGKSDIKEYWLNDGQTLIKTTYNTTASINAAILNFRTLRNEFLNNGRRMVRLVDQSNFRRYGW